MAYLVGDASGTIINGTAEDDLIYGSDPAASDPTGIAAQRVAAGLSEPVFATAPPEDFSSLFIVERTGTIQRLDLNEGEFAAQPVLDVSDGIATTGEQGLLGLAFHPDFAETGQFFVSLTNLDGDSEIRSYRMVDGQADPDSAQLVLSIDQPDQFANHKGGWLGFGPDGDLYASFGDGGISGNAQDANSLLGKILRLDVDGPAGTYAIPDDNPFVGTAGADEVWALGLRNPWRAGFDGATGDLFIADVGASDFEEVNLGAPGANYGWDALEGPLGRDGGGLSSPATPPIQVYEHVEGGEVIVGGTVYRGPAEALQGQYLFADFGTDRLWTMHQDGDEWVAVERTAQVTTDSGNIGAPTGFGEDARGNLYLLDLDGDVFRLDPQGNPPDGGDVVSGGDGADFIYGGGGGDSLFGNADDDRLIGQSGADILAGGAGDDRLDGGPGADRFVFAPGGGSDTIVDFSPDDTIAVTPSLNGDILGNAQAVDGGVLLALGEGTEVLLVGITVGQLSGQDFVLA